MSAYTFVSTLTSLAYQGKHCVRSACQRKVGPKKENGTENKAETHFICTPHVGELTTRPRLLVFLPFFISNSKVPSLLRSDLKDLFHGFHI